MTTSGGVGAYGGDQLFGVLGTGDDLVSGADEERDQAFAQQRGVLGEDDPQRATCHGHSIRTRVGPPVGLVTSSVPPSASSRVTNPESPDPVPITAPPYAVVGDHDDQ